MRLLPCLLAAIAAAVLLSACTTSEPRWTTLGPWPAADGKLPAPPVPEPNSHCLPGSTTACAAIVEFDDSGVALNRAQLLGAVEEAERAARAGATVVVYVHGWHENAEPEAPDLNSFLNFVAEADVIDGLNRHGGFGSRRGNVFGIFVGWRGDSIAVRHASREDPWQAETAWTAPASYLLTFWNRKDAAQRIGSSGGVYELFERLAQVRRANRQSRLVIHGHSFGGALVYSAFSTSLVDQLMADAAAANSGEAGRAGSEPEPVADLVVLLNPAFEAMRLRPQLDLARTQEYPDGGAPGKPLPPRLVILTTEADWATRIAFPLGRKLGTMTDIYPKQLESEMKAANVTAVGHYIPYITHQLTPLPPSQICPVERRDPRLQAHALELQEPTLCIPGVQQTRAVAPVPALLLARCDNTQLCSQVAPGHYLTRGPVAQGFVPLRMPIMNIRTVAAVSDSHTDIWNPLVQSFMLQLTTLAVRSPGVLPMAPAPVR